MFQTLSNGSNAAGTELRRDRVDRRRRGGEGDECVVESFLHRIGPSAEDRRPDSLPVRTTDPPPSSSAISAMLNSPLFCLDLLRWLHVIKYFSSVMIFSMNVDGWESMDFVGVKAAISVCVSNELGLGHPRAARYSVYVTLFHGSAL